MIRLHQTFGAHAGRVLELDRDVIRIGRLPENDIAFDPHADLDASGRHAEIRREGTSWVVVDVGSRNGTLLAGQRVTRHVLSHGDEVEFGLGGPRLRVDLSVADGIKETALATPVGAMPPGHSLPPVGPPPGSPPSGGAPPAPFGGPVTPAPVSHPSAGPVSAPSGERRFGHRTVGMMIQQALAEAEQARSHGGNRSTAFIRAVAQETVASTSRGLKIGLSLVTLLVFITVGAVVALFFYARWQEQDLRDENVRLQRRLAELDTQDVNERSRLGERIQELNRRLHEQQQAVGTSIAETHDLSVYLLVGIRSGGRRDAHCSAFAVRERLLATNARCVSALETARGRGHRLVAVVNHGGDVVIERMWRHPSYDASADASPDIGLVQIAEPSAAQVQLASMSDLAGLRVGDEVFVFGFPGPSPEAERPVASLTTGVVGRLNAFDGTAGEPRTRHLVSHSALTVGAARGSPVFDREGHVVAVNAGNYRASTQVTDTGSRIRRTVDAETPYAWAVRVDLLHQLLRGMPDI